MYRKLEMVDKLPGYVHGGQESSPLQKNWPRAFSIGNFELDGGRASRRKPPTVAPGVAGGSPSEPFRLAGVRERRPRRSRSHDRTRPREG